MRIGAVILAGGEGRRLGGNKPRKLLRGKPLFEHVLDRVTSWGLPCAVALRSTSEAVFAAGLALLHDEEDAGPIGGIASAIRRAESEGWDAVLTLPCDTPLLPSDLPEKLASALAPPALAAVPRTGDRLHPSCALWSARAAAALPAYLVQRRSLTGFAERLNASVVDWPIDAYDPFLNVNTEEDLEAAERLLRSR